MSLKNILPVYLLATMLFACDRYRVYETNYDFKNKQWYADTSVVYTFDIEDTTSKYNVLYNVRSTLNYPFYNLYVSYKLFGSDNKLISNDLQEVQLMDAKTGEPFGSGLGDIFDNKFYAIKGISFPKAGKYKIKMQQYMRKDPLQEILAFGIRVEKTKPE